jgi:hypothetical protein
VTELTPEPKRVAPPVQRSAPVPAGWHHDAASGRMRWWDGVEWTDTYGAVARPWKPTNHIFHLLMTLLTAGLWIPIWIIVGVSNNSRK